MSFVVLHFALESTQSPPGTYDILLSDAEFVQQLNAAGYIEEMDAADYPFDDFFPEFQNFPGHWTGDQLWSVMCRYGHLGVSFNTEVISHKEAMTYNVLWDKRLTGKVGHFDWHLPNLGCLSLRDGNNDPSPFDISEAQWQKLQATTLSLKPQVGGYFDYGGTFSSLKNGEINAMCGIGDWITGVLQTLPLVVILQTFSLAGVERNLIEAAWNLGCSRWRTIFRVIIPSAKVGLILGAVFCFILSFGDFVAPYYLGGSKPPTLSILIIDTTKSGQQWPRAAVVAVTMIVTLLVVAFAAVSAAYRKPKQ